MKDRVQFFKTFDLFKTLNISIDLKTNPFFLLNLNRKEISILLISFFPQGC